MRELSSDALVNAALLESRHPAMGSGVGLMDSTKKIELAGKDFDWSDDYRRYLVKEFRSFDERDVDYSDYISDYEFSVQVNTKEIITMPGIASDSEVSRNRHLDPAIIPAGKGDEQIGDLSYDPLKSDGVSDLCDLGLEKEKSLDGIESVVNLSENLAEDIQVNLDEIVEEMLSVIEDFSAKKIPMEHFEQLRKNICIFWENCASQIHAVDQLTRFVEIASSSKDSLRERYQNHEKFPGKKVREGHNVVDHNPVDFLRNVWKEEIGCEYFHTGILCTVDEPLYRALDSERRKKDGDWSEFGIFTKEQSNIAKMKTVHRLFGGKFSLETIKRFFNSFAKYSYNTPIAA